MNWRFMAIGIICVLIGFIVGSQMQQYKELNWCVKTGLFFLEAKNIKIDVNEAAISAALMYYHQRVDRLIATNFSSIGS